MSAQILLADDDASLRLVLSQALSREGFQVRATASLSTLAKWAKDGEGDLVVSDVYLGDDNLFDTLPALKAQRPELPVIVMSGQSTVLTALSAVGGGAYEYLPKPFDLDTLMEAARRAVSRKADAKTRARAAHAEQEERLPLIGRSAAMQEVYRLIARVAGTDLTVLIEGEPGSGKDLVARTLHGFGRRKFGKFVAVSLAQTAEAVETALFGKDGAGGRLAEADRGVLYLDDIDDMPPPAQTRLLRALQESETRAGPDVRIIAAAKRSLIDLARMGAFRPDLLYRLNVVTIRLPPLRERLDDVGDLARACLVRIKREGLPEKTLDGGAVEALKRHDWPGNVRELENLLRRIAALRPEPVITAHEIEQELRPLARAALAGVEADLDFDSVVRRHTRVALASAQEDGKLYDAMVEQLERPLIECTLEATGGNQIKAASILGINRNTLRKKIVALGLRGARDD